MYLENKTHFMATLPTYIDPSSTSNTNTSDFYHYSYDYASPTTNDNYSDIDGEEDYALRVSYKIGDFLTHYYTPTLVLFGSIGNILSVIVFFRTKLKKLSSSYYLAALGISDTVFLLAAFISWLNFIDVNVYNQEYYCQFFTYISGLCSFLSVWFVVAFTVERFIAVLYPLKRQTMCTVKRACTVLVGLCFTGVFICIPYFIYAAPKYSEALDNYVCDVRDEYKLQMQIFNYIDTVIVFVIPFTTIVILNTFTALAVWKVAGVRRTMTVQKRKPHIRDFKNKSNHSTLKLNYSNIQNQSLHSCFKTTKKTANSSQIKVTKMLLLVSTVFVILNLPSYIMRIKVFLIKNDGTTTDATIITQYICWFFFITNFGINFALYCLSGQNFRKAVISMFSVFKKNHVAQPDVGTTQVTVSEYLKQSTSSASAKRFLRNGSGGDIQELQPTRINTSSWNNYKIKSKSPI